MTSAVDWPSVCIVGPLPPPSGGMANQCEQLVRLLRADGVPVDLVCNNLPYWPSWIARVPLLRAMARLAPYLVRLWLATGRAQVVHVLANSGWAWHLFCATALVIARLRGTPVIVNYRGGQADAFFAGAPAHVLNGLRRVAMRVTPSAYLVRVFEKYGLDAEVIPNIIDLTRFSAAQRIRDADAPHVVVARNLEPIYDLPTALHAFALIRRRLPKARLTIAGSGPELGRLEALASRLHVADAVHFPGRIDHSAMPLLYATADCALNPSTVDNMPNSVLEAFASGVPVVSTDVGGVPDIVTHGVSGLLVPVSDPDAMAREVLRVLEDPGLASRLVAAAHAEVNRYSWPQVKGHWLSAYRRAARHRRRGAR